MNGTVTRTTLLIALVFAWGLLLSCGSGGNSTPAPTNSNPSSTVTSVIGPVGGTLTTPTGEQVVIPPGALSSNTAITLGPVSQNMINQILQRDPNKEGLTYL